ncbi:conserved hypothetical protein [Desulfamplus magnetovallimortis]|uniref:VWFA domain-containing protein n=1 Tax=Desulfamplus magnetovallimortis TaxID=1246637 RepID=A0A1W1H922_9BACT|nr:hypothetical protein [Desulfamplus magnetovallimortis]SLM28905.1 conserved hypothetical protein [Desulfamplus magnetovallimortis]
MGRGTYSVSERSARSVAMGYATKSVNEIFSQSSINNAMNPYGVKIRESRDSDEHPDTVSIILALDVTGSMGSIPHHLVKEGLPKIMGNIIQGGTRDPQLLFLAVGDHECDNSPLQVGQFESSDELLDKWLTDVYLEGGGGGNKGESYLLAWYFAAFHTSIDCFEKRGRKGFLFTIGDEPTLDDIPAKALKNIMGDGQYETYHATVLLDKAREKYHVFHLHIKQTYAGGLQETIDGWKQLMGDHLIVLDRHEEISKVIPQIVADTTRSVSTSTPSIPDISQTKIIL